MLSTNNRPSDENNQPRPLLQTSPLRLLHKLRLQHRPLLQLKPRRPLRKRSLRRPLPSPRLKLLLQLLLPLVLLPPPLLSRTPSPSPQYLLILQFPRRRLKHQLRSPLSPLSWRSLRRRRLLSPQNPPTRLPLRRLLLSRRRVSRLSSNWPIFMQSLIVQKPSQNR